MSFVPVLTFMAHKGGVGRTLILLQLAGAIAERARVLIIDQDSQSSISRNVFSKPTVDAFRPNQTVAAVYRDEPYDPTALVHETPFENLFIVPSSKHLRPFDLPLAERPEELQFRLKQYVAAVRDDFDMVLIDTAPNIHNLPGMSALNASEFIITIVEPDKNSLESVSEVKAVASEILHTTNPDLTDLGCIFTNASKNESVDQAAELTLRRLYGSQVFETVLWRRTKLKQTKFKYKPQTHVAPNSEEAQMFRVLLGELIQRMNQQIDVEKTTLAAND